MLLLALLPTASPVGIAPARASGPVFSVASGSWSDPQVWSAGSVPGSGDAVTVNARHSVIYDVFSEEALGDLSILGTLRFSRITDTRLKTAGNVFVGPGGGLLDMGTADYPIPSHRRAELTLIRKCGMTLV